MKKLIIAAIFLATFISSAQIQQPVLTNNNPTPFYPTQNINTEYGSIRVGICRTEYMGTTRIKYGTGTDGNYYRIMTYSMRDENGLQRTKTAVLVLNESPCN